MNYTRIPKEYQVGGTKMIVKGVERCNNNSAGECFLAGGYVEIADKLNKCDQQSEDSKRNTFYHELIHSILDTMGESDLSSNERFVSCFAGFLTEAMTNAWFYE